MLSFWDNKVGDSDHGVSLFWESYYFDGHFMQLCDFALMY